MASAYSQDLRDRVIGAVVGEGMSRRAAAARFGVSESSAIKWVQRFERSGLRAASKMGGYLRPRLEPHREFLEAVRAEKTDITLKALCDRLRTERGVRADTAMMRGLSGILCVRLISSLSDEPFAEDDGELGLGLEPLTRRPLPFFGRVVENEI